jgi:hypothetical protein
MTLTTRANLRLTTDLRNSLDLVTPQALQQFVYDLTLTSGVGLNQANVIWSDRRTVNASTTDSLDMAGSLTDALGQAFTPARVKAIGLKLPSNAAQNVALTRPASNGVPFLTAAGDSIPVAPGGLALLVWPTAAGIVVTASTGDLIDVVNGAGSAVTYDIVIIGGSS